MTELLVRFGLRILEKSIFRRNLSQIRIDRPIFIVGLPGSGAAGLYDRLCTHENAAYVTRAIDRYPDSVLAAEWLRRTLFPDALGGPCEPSQLWHDWRRRDLASDVRKILYAFGSDASGQGARRRLICHFNPFLTELPRLSELFPDAYFVHVVRDGRLAAQRLLELNPRSSYPRLQALPGIIEKYGADTLQCAAQVWQSSIDAVHVSRDHVANFIEVRYEDLLADPTSQILSLLNRLNLPRPDASNSTFWNSLEESTEDDAPIVPLQAEVIEKIAGRTLRRLGYLPGGDDTSLPPPLHRPHASWELDRGAPIMHC